MSGDMEEVQPMLNININLIDVLDYVGDSVRPIREGLSVKDSNHIVCLGYTKQDRLYIHAKGYVLQSSNPAGRPHEVNLRFHKVDNKDWELGCSCKAGTRRCKHIVACLLQIDQFKTLELMTCTDATQAWGTSRIEKTSLWGAKLVKDLCCVRSTKMVECIDDELRQSVVVDAFDRLMKAAPQSAVSKHKAGRQLNPIQFQTSVRPCGSVTNQHQQYCLIDELKQIFGTDDTTITVPSNSFLNQQQRQYFEKYVVVSRRKILEIAIETSSQGNSAWKLHRSIRITASSCYGLFTYTKNAKPDWDRKITSFLNPKAFETKNMRYGKHTEVAAFECYRQKRNPNIKKTGFIIDEREPWLGASPDGVDLLSQVVLEIKCPASGAEQNLEWILMNCSATKRYIKICTDESTSEKKYLLNKSHAYYAQVQINMYILKCTRADFVVYSSKESDFLTIEVEFDIDFVKQLLETLKVVYFNRILPVLAQK